MDNLEEARELLAQMIVYFENFEQGDELAGDVIDNLEYILDTLRGDL